MIDGETVLHHSIEEADDARRQRDAAQLYYRVFEQNPDGKLVLELLERQFCRKLWVAGGIEGARQTDFNNGQFSVINHINLMLSRAIYGGHDNAGDS